MLGPTLQDGMPELFGHCFGLAIYPVVSVSGVPILTFLILYWIRSFSMLKLIRMAGLVLVAICHLFPGKPFAESIVGPTRAVPGAYFGMHCFYCGASLRWPGEVDTTLPMGVGLWRLWDALGSTWLSVEPAKGTWDFSYLDHYVAKGQSRGTELVLTLGQTPTWASARPLEIGGGGAGAAAEPANIQDWQDYVAKVATRLQRENCLL